MNSIRKQKTQQVDQLTSKLKDSSALVVFSYHGLSVPAMQELRQKLTENDVELKVYKNRLVKIAAKNAGYEDLNKSLIGPNAFAFSASDDIAPAKIISEFAKKHESLKMIAGTYENKVVFSEELLSIAALPSMEEALTMLASSLLSPLRYIAVGLNMIKDLDSKSEVKEETKEVETNVETKEEIQTPSDEIKQSELNKEENNV
jgi:large subunit ribosomal protein L10